MSLLDKILNIIIPSPKDRKPPCPSLYWTLPDKIQIGKKERMKPVCDLGLKTGPTCGGFYSKEPACGSYELQINNTVEYSPKNT